ncbi:LuxR family transcriptional regulator [Frankia sp. B2]|nr:LuxR family transcriptional regulator [Frankia sp. B2]
MPSGEVAVPAPAWPATPRRSVMSGRMARPALMTPAARSAPPDRDRQGADVPRGPSGPSGPSGPAGYGLGTGTSPISLGQPGARERSPGSRDGRGPGAGGRLSDRELAVLSYLPTMLTTTEIAAELFVSVNTVKTHLKSIYRKLDVPRRRDAVHRARELRLL